MEHAAFKTSHEPATRISTGTSAPQRRRFASVFDLPWRAAGEKPGMAWQISATLVPMLLIYLPRRRAYILSLHSITTPGTSGALFIVFARHPGANSLN